SARHQLLTTPTHTRHHHLSLHDALPISHPPRHERGRPCGRPLETAWERDLFGGFFEIRLGRLGVRDVLELFGGVVVLVLVVEILDRKSTRLNSSHVAISYAVFCLKTRNT